MSAAERLAAVLHTLPVPDVDSVDASHLISDCEQDAPRLLAADPGLAAAIDLGLAWQEAEAALPEGWVLASVDHWMDGSIKWTAHVIPLPQPAQYVLGGGDTPAEALRALAAKLAEAAS